LNKLLYLGYGDFITTKIVKVQEEAERRMLRAGFMDDRSIGDMAATTRKGPHGTHDMTFRQDFTKERGEIKEI